MEEKFKYNTIEEAIAAIRAGKMVLVTDDEDRENEGDLIMAAELCTPEAINFMAKEARGLICMPAAGEVMDKLQLGAMVSKTLTTMKLLFPYPSTTSILLLVFLLMNALTPCKNAVMKARNLAISVVLVMCSRYVQKKVVF